MDAEYAVIGAGIIGSAIARELSFRSHDVLVIEKEDYLGMHQSGRNSGVLHSGITISPGTLKAKLCVEGNAIARMYCETHDIPITACGTLLVAKKKEEIPALEKLLDMGNMIGVPRLRLITRGELLEKEPYIEGAAALFSPTGAIIDSISFLESIVSEAQANHATFIYGREATGIRDQTIVTTTGEITAKHIINAAGLHADTLAHSAGMGKKYAIIPFRGDYYAIADAHLHSMVYQIPDLSFPFKGVHLARTTDGTVIAGPTATLSFGREAYDKQINYHDTLSMFASPQFWRLIAHPKFRALVKENLRISFSRIAFTDEIRKMYPTVHESDLVPYQSGIRAQLIGPQGQFCHDIIIERQEHQTHILNAVSPGLTSSLAFAKYVVDGLRE